MALDNATVLNGLKEKFGDAIIHGYEPYGMLTVIVERANIMDILAYLKDDATTQMNFMTSLCGIHYPGNTGKELGVIYHLHSFTNNLRMRVEVFFPEDDAVMPTATKLWNAANWLERETFEFYGIRFEGHPDLRVILNVEEIDYHPLLKQYPLEDDTRTDKDDRFFGRQGNEGRTFDERIDRTLQQKRIAEGK